MLIAGFDLDTWQFWQFSSTYVYVMGFDRHMLIVGLCEINDLDTYFLFHLWDFSI